MSALLYRISRTAKANGLEPYEYLLVLFGQLPASTAEDTDADKALMHWGLAEWRTQTADSKDPPTTAAVSVDMSQPGPYLA